MIVSLHNVQKTRQVFLYQVWWVLFDCVTQVLGLTLWKSIIMVVYLFILIMAIALIAGCLLQQFEKDLEEEAFQTVPRAGYWIFCRLISMTKEPWFDGQWWRFPGGVHKSIGRECFSRMAGCVLVLVMAVLDWNNVPQLTVVFLTYCISCSSLLGFHHLSAFMTLI